MTDNSYHNPSCPHESGAAGRGDPAPRHARGLAPGETAGLLRHSAPRNDRSAYSLWLWVAGAFFVTLLAWVVLFTVVQRTQVQSVPLEPKGVRP